MSALNESITNSLLDSCVSEANPLPSQTTPSPSRWSISSIAWGAVSGTAKAVAGATLGCATCVGNVLGVHPLLEKIGVFEPLDMIKIQQETYAKILKMCSENGFKTTYDCFQYLQSQQQNAVLYVLLGAPVLEELACRGVIQQGLLRKLPSMLLARFAPGNESLVDQSWIKTARILLTSALFSAIHLSNGAFMADELVQRQLAATFVVGIVLGLAAESRLGLLGAIAGHVGNNALAVLGQQFLQ